MRMDRARQALGIEEWFTRSELRYSICGSLCPLTRPFPDFLDGHYVRMMQAGRNSGLGLKSAVELIAGELAE
jgi:hypothetical protein